MENECHPELGSGSNNLTTYEMLNQVQHDFFGFGFDLNLEL